MSSETTWTWSEIDWALRSDGISDGRCAEFRRILEAIAARRSQPAPEAATTGPRWRVGTKVPRNLYRDGVDVGRVDTPELAAAIVKAMNRAAPEAVATLDQATVDRLAAEGRELSRELQDRVKKMRTPEAAVVERTCPLWCGTLTRDHAEDTEHTPGWVTTGDRPASMRCWCTPGCRLRGRPLHPADRAKAKAGEPAARRGWTRGDFDPPPAEQPAAPGGFSTPRPWPWPAPEVHPEDARLARERLLPSPRAPEESEQPAAPPGFVLGEGWRIVDPAPRAGCYKCRGQAQGTLVKDGAFLYCRPCAEAAGAIVRAPVTPAAVQGEPLSAGLAPWIDGRLPLVSLDLRVVQEKVAALEARLADARETIVAQNIAYDRLEASSADLVRRAQEAEAQVASFQLSQIREAQIAVAREGTIAELRGKLAAATDSARRGWKAAKGLECCHDHAQGAEDCDAELAALGNEGAPAPEVG